MKWKMLNRAWRWNTLWHVFWNRNTLYKINTPIFGSYDIVEFVPMFCFSQVIFHSKPYCDRGFCWNGIYCRRWNALVLSQQFMRSTYDRARLVCKMFLIEKFHSFNNLWRWSFTRHKTHIIWTWHTRKVPFSINFNCIETHSRHRTIWWFWLASGQILRFAQRIASKMTEKITDSWRIH